MQTVDDIFTAFTNIFESRREAEISLREAEKSLAEYLEARMKERLAYSTAVEQVLSAIRESKNAGAPENPRREWIRNAYNAAPTPAAIDDRSGKRSRVRVGWKAEKPKRRIWAVRTAAVLGVLLALSGDVLKEGAGHAAGEAIMHVYRDRDHYLTEMGEAVRGCAESAVTALSDAGRSIVQHCWPSRPPKVTPDQHGRFPFEDA